MTSKQTFAVCATLLGCVMFLCLTYVLVHGPQDTQTMLIEAAGGSGVAAAGAAFLAWFLRDADGDGVPDRFQTKDEEE